MPMFRKPCNPLHQGKEQSELFLQAIPFISCCCWNGGGEEDGISWSSTGRMVFYILFIFYFVVAVISIQIVRVFLYLYGFSILSWKVCNVG